MKIIIKDTSSIKEIQQAFSEVYPFLRIEFFKTRHIPGKLFSKKDRIAPSEKTGWLNKFQKEAGVQIDAARTVTELEKEFMDILGLYVQVLRRSGSSWIQTSLTDDWSLGRQNREAELLSMPYAAKAWQERLEDNKFDGE